MQQLIDQFLSYCEVERGKSAYTIRDYAHYLARFCNWCEQNHIANPSQITLKNITSYRIYLNRYKPTLSKKTQNFHIIALRAFLKYLSKNDIQTLPPEKIELSREEGRQISFLTDEELEILLQEPDTSNIIGIRDVAIMHLLFSTGLRVSELVSLDRENINFSSNEFSVKGKGAKIRVVFISKNAKNYLKAYIDMRKDDKKALFINYSRKTSRLSARSIQRQIKKYAQNAGIAKKITPHIFRHTFGTDLLRSGADLRAVQELMGHSSITTTQIYTHVTDKHLREVHQAFHARRIKKEK